MVAVKAHEVTRAIERLDPAWRLILVYGPDAGLVSERVELIVGRLLGEARDDPFSSARIDGDDLASEPTRLLDEASTIPLFGGKRVIRVGRTGKNIAPAVELVLKETLADAAIVIEGGELNNRNALRVVCEKSPRAVALPCYGDEARGLGDLADAMLRESGLTLDRGARETLLAALGSDRLLSRQEIAKLVTYMGSEKRVTVADIEAIVGDSAVREVDTVVDAVVAGDWQKADAAFVKLSAEGLDPGVLLGHLLRHLLTLSQLRTRVDDGQSPQAIVDTMRLPLPRKTALQAALANWKAPMLAAGVVRLGETTLEIRRQPSLGPQLAHRTLMSLAYGVRSRRS